MILKTPKNFSLEGTVFSHGWYQLAPFHYDRESGGLSYVFGRPSAKSAIFASVTQSGEELKIRSENHDLTDEDAFRAIALRGLAVLVRPELRETAAACWLRPPEELLEFLDRWKDACGQSI